MAGVLRAILQFMRTGFTLLFIPFLALSVRMAPVSPAVWGFLRCGRTGHDLAVPWTLPCALWPLGKKPGKGSASWTSLYGKLSNH